MSSHTMIVLLNEDGYLEAKLTCNKPNECKDSYGTHSQHCSQVDLFEDQWREEILIPPNGVKLEICKLKAVIEWRNDDTALFHISKENGE